MKILGIETSCDETAVAVLEGDGDQIKLIDSLVASQIKDHAKYGGVVPEIAARKHVDVLFGLLEAIGVNHDGSDIDVIAVTQGPGLSPALRVGLSAAKTLATLWDKPIVGVNHLEGHVYSVLLEQKNVKTEELKNLQFPTICLLVSGGHTEIVLMKDYGKYELLGQTRDDAAGEAFDKVAKLLGLGYPGGPIVSEKAEQGDPAAIKFPRPMLDSGDYDFSFSGLKTAVLYHLRDNPKDKVEDICASFQQAVVDVLVTKTMRAVKKYNPKSVVLGGGVSANKQLRSQLKKQVEKAGLELLAPDLEHSGDNAAMIAAAGYFQAQANQYSDLENMTAKPNLNL
jgi:N6-L-threonylcarbamoyladenine synthase